jgi:hypothetical protein
VGDLCPRCGALLEPVAALSEILGFQSIRTRVEADLDPARWLDDGGSFPGVATPRHPPETY